MLSAIWSRRRQERVLEVMNRRGIEAAVFGSAHHVYYLTAHLTHPLQRSALLLRADGRSILWTANAPNAAAAADDLRGYPANAMSTLRPDQERQLATLLSGELKSGDRIGMDASAVTSQLAMVSNPPHLSVDDDLHQLRRVKDPDELELMQKAIACCQAMYARARQIIEPGVPELEVFAQLHRAAILEAGEPLRPAYLGNDYACGVAGGPARDGRLAAGGELYILDLGPAYRGYFSDNARTIAVDRFPTDVQLAAWERVTNCLKIVEQMARPGVRCVEIFKAVDDYLDGARGLRMTHHLGHGVGLEPHEFPHLNPNWDDTLMEGEVFTAEPGEYGEALRGGIRIENQYRVTATGVENLVDVSLAMT